MKRDQKLALNECLQERFSDASAEDTLDGLSPAATGTLLGMASRGSCRAFRDQAVPLEMMRTLSAVALSSPTKSDLQQRDLVILQDTDTRAALGKLVDGQGWVAKAPMIVIFCGNNKRQRALHTWRDVAFANDHLDAFFNASVDAAIALGAFVTAAEAVGLGCCPISAVRNHPEDVSDLLALPVHVFPVAGLAVGYPEDPPAISQRLPLSQTIHIDQFDDARLRQDVAAYDSTRASTQPYAHQRFPDTFGTSESYCWSEDKVRQYSAPERGTFGAFIRARGFCLD